LRIRRSGTPYYGAATARGQSHDGRSGQQTGAPRRGERCPIQPYDQGPYCHPRRYQTACASPTVGEGSYIISCGLDRNLILWNPHTGLPIKTYKGHANEVNDVSSSKDNSQLVRLGASCLISTLTALAFTMCQVSAGGDRAVFNWDVATGRVIRKFNGHLAVTLRTSLNDAVACNGWGCARRCLYCDCAARQRSKVQRREHGGRIRLV
jgi:hypothetical protein